jgi:hypothetical protein
VLSQGEFVPKAERKLYMDWAVIRESNHPTDDVNVLIGMEHGQGAYMVFRGDPTKVLQFIQEMAQEAAQLLSEDNYTDMRRLEGND